MNKLSECPCGSALQYDQCCGAIHSHARPAKTAEQLMRSRYSAFVLENEAYLLESWHPDTRPSNVQFDQNSKWLGLKIKSTSMGQAQDKEGWVSFVARYKLGGKAERIVENSYFLRVDERWVYHSAQD